MLIIETQYKQTAAGCKTREATITIIFSPMSGDAEKKKEEYNNPKRFKMIVKTQAELLKILVGRVS